MKRAAALVLLSFAGALASGVESQAQTRRPSKTTTSAKRPSASQPVRGPRGEPGPKGEKGDKGDRGDKGERGDKGDPGEVPQWVLVAAGAALGFSLLAAPALALSILNWMKLGRMSPPGVVPTFSPPESSQLVQILNPPSWVKSVDVRIGVSDGRGAPAPAPAAAAPEPGAPAGPITLVDKPVQLD
jgi:hypothetical protein